MQLTVKSLKGSFKLDGLSSDLSIPDLLQNVCKQCTQQPESSGSSSHYLVHKENVLDQGTLSSAGLADGDTVVMLTRPAVHAPEPLQDGPAPDAAAIREAIIQEARTRGIDISTQPEEPPPRASRRGLHGLPRDLQDTDARLLQLISALGGHLHVMRDMPREEERAAEPASPPAEIQPPEPPQDALQQLMDMGFPEAVVRKALILNRNQMEYALEWLLQHAEDPNADEPVTQEQLRRIYGAPPRSRSVAASRSGSMRQRMIDQLVEMGFGAEDSGQALDSFHTLDVALQWLLNRQAEGRSLIQGSAPPPTPSSEPSTPSAAVAAQQQQSQQNASLSEAIGSQDTPQPGSGPTGDSTGSGEAGAEVRSLVRQDEAPGRSPLSRQTGAAGTVAGDTLMSDGDGDEEDEDEEEDEEEEEVREEDAEVEDEEEDEEDEDEDEGEDEEEEEDEEDDMDAQVYLPTFMTVSSAEMEQLMQGMNEMYGGTAFLSGDMEGTEMLMQMGPADAAQLMNEMLQVAQAGRTGSSGQEGRGQSGAQHDEVPEPPM